MARSSQSSISGQGAPSTVREAVVAFLGRYRVGIKRALSVAYGEEALRDLARARKDGLVESFRYAGSTAGYYLTAAGLRSANLPPKRNDVLRERSLAQCTAAMWASWLGPVKRHRPEYSEIGILAGAPPPKGGVYLVDDSGEALWRVYAPSLTTSDSTILRQAGRSMEVLARHQHLAPWVSARRLGLLVLVPEPEREGPVAATLESLTDQFRVEVEHAPQPETLAEALRRRSP